jgi:hypothetical protein
MRGKWQQKQQGGSHRQAVLSDLIKRALGGSQFISKCNDVHAPYYKVVQSN